MLSRRRRHVKNDIFTSFRSDIDYCGKEEVGRKKKMILAREPCKNEILAVFLYLLAKEYMSKKIVALWVILFMGENAWRGLVI